MVRNFLSASKGSKKMKSMEKNQGIFATFKCFQLIQVEEYRYEIPP